MALISVLQRPIILKPVPGTAERWGSLLGGGDPWEVLGGGGEWRNVPLQDVSSSFFHFTTMKGMVSLLHVLPTMMCSLATDPKPIRLWSKASKILSQNKSFTLQVDYLRSFSP